MGYITEYVWQQILLLKRISCPYYMIFFYIKLSCECFQHWDFRYKFYCWYSILFSFMVCKPIKYKLFSKLSNQLTGCISSRWALSWPWVPPGGILLHRLPGGGRHDLLHMSENGLQAKGHLPHTMYRDQRSATVELLRCQGHSRMCRSVTDVGQIPR